MELKHYPRSKFKKEVLRVIGRYLDLKKYQVFFFGSRISGKGSERSDIDIGIMGPGRIPLDTILEIKKELNNLLMLYKIDIVDFKSASRDFRRVALKEIEPISSRP